MDLDFVSIPNDPESATHAVSRCMCLPLPPWVTALCPRLEASKQLPTTACRADVLLEVRRGDHEVLVSATLRNAWSLNFDEFHAAVTEAYLAVFAALSRAGAAHPVRMWNFIPNIHDAMGSGQNRYHVFNGARFDAFARWLAVSEAQTPPDAVFGRSLPAASGVGHAAEDLLIHALGTAEPGRPVENPLQIPAFSYSMAHGPRPPCFSRATIAHLHGARAGPTLLVSGTASIRGEDSRHEGNLVAQFTESLENIDRLAASIEGLPRFTLEGVETARVYHSRPVDREWLERAIHSCLPGSATIEVCAGVICRAELLVEIEATIAPSAEGGGQAVRLA